MVSHGLTMEGKEMVKYSQEERKNALNIVINVALYGLLFTMLSAIIVGLIIVCIIGPIEGNWSPDLAVAIWGLVISLLYLVYRITLYYKRKGGK